MNHYNLLLYVARDKSAVFNTFAVSEALQVDEGVIISYKNISHLHDEEVVLLSKFVFRLLNRL